MSTIGQMTPPSPFDISARLISLELEGVDILVYTPEEFIEMKRAGNAFAEMIMEEGIIIYERQTEN